MVPGFFFSEVPPRAFQLSPGDDLFSQYIWITPLGYISEDITVYGSLSCISSLLLLLCCAAVCDISDAAGWFRSHDLSGQSWHVNVTRGHVTRGRTSIMGADTLLYVTGILRVVWYVLVARATNVYTNSRCGMVLMK